MISACVLLCLVVVSIRLMGGLWAKYVISENAGDGARAAKFGLVSITETTGSTYKIIPGVDITKDPRLSFGGAETSCVVFLTVDLGNWTSVGNFGFKYGGTTGDRLQWSVDDTKWTFLKTDGTKCVYYTLVEANETLSDVPLIKDDKVTVDDDLIRSEMTAMVAVPEIVFEGIVMQTGGMPGEFTADADIALAAWNMVSTH